MANTDLISSVVSSESFKELERLNLLLDATVEKFVSALGSAKAFDAGITGSGSLKEFKEATKSLVTEQQKLTKISNDIVAVQEKRILAEGRLSQVLAQEKILLQQTNKENTNRAKIQLTEAGSLSRLEAVRVRLLASQKALNLTTEEGQRKNALYIKSLDKITESIRAGSAAAERQRMNVGNYQGSAKIIVDAMERARVKVIDLEKAFGKAGPEAQQARKEFETLKRVTDNPQFLNISAKVGDTTKELRYFTKQLNQMEDAGLKNSAVYKEVQARLAHLTDQLSDTRAEVKALSSDTRGFDLFAGSVRLAADSFQTAAGAAVLFGASEEDAAKATRTLIAVQSVANGVKSIAKDLTTEGTAANKVYAFVQLQMAAAANTAATATGRLALATKALAGGVVVLGLMALAKVMNLFGNETENTTDAIDKQNEAIQRLDDSYELLNREISRGERLQIARAKLLGKDDEDITEIQIKNNERRIVGLGNEYQAIQKVIDANSEARFAAIRQVESLPSGIMNEGRKKNAIIKINEEYAARTKDLFKKQNDIANQQQDINVDNQVLEINNQISFNEKKATVTDKGAKEVRKIKQDNGNKELEEAKLRAEELAKFEAGLSGGASAAGRTIEEIKAEKAVKAFERVRDDEKNVFTQRLLAGKIAAQLQIEQLQKVADFEKNKLTEEAIEEKESILGRKLTATERIDVAIKTASQRLAIEKKLETDIFEVNYDAADKEKAILKGVADFKKEQDEKELEADKKKKEELLQKEKDFQDQKKKLLTDLQKEAENTLVAFIDAGFQKQKQRLDQESIMLDKNKAKQLDRINALNISEEEKAAKIAILDANVQAGKESIARRQRQIDIDKARFDKQKAIFDIGIATAVAIVKVIPNPVLIALVSAISALQLAAVIARPIPQFKTGKKKGQRVDGGMAYVDDGGRAEVVEREGGGIEIGTSKARVTYLSDNDIVHPSIDAYLQSIKNKSGGITEQKSDANFIKWQIENASLQTERMIEAYKSSPKAVVNISPFGLEVLEKTQNGWINYIDKMVRHKK
jgi:hypothetical protein